MEYFLTFFQRYSSKPREGGEAAPKKNNEQSIAVIPAQNDVTQQIAPTLERSDRYKCGKCKENRIKLLAFSSLYECVLCRSSCWNDQPSYSNVENRMIDIEDLAFCQDLFSTNESPQTHHQLHIADTASQWFSLNTDVEDRPAFIKTNVYSGLIASSKFEDPSQQYPSLVSLVGPTGAGKSTLIKGLMKLDLSLEDICETPIAGNPNDKGQPTSSDVHLYADPKTLHTEQPILFADCEGLDGGNREPVAHSHRVAARAEMSAKYGILKPLGDTYQYIKSATLKPLKWVLDKSSKHDKITRQYGVEDLYPRILYTFSDVLCFVAEQGNITEVTLHRLVRWADKALTRSINQPALPCAIIIFNGLKDAPLSWLDEEFATSKTLGKVENSNLKDPSISDIVSGWRAKLDGTNKQIKTLQDLLECYFRRIRVVYIPQRGQVTPDVLCGQYRKLSKLVHSECRVSQEQKHVSWNRMNAADLDMYFNAAFDHFSENRDVPFDFFEFSRKNNPVSETFSQHVANLMMKMNKREPDRTIAEQRVVPLVVSCISVSTLDSKKYKFGPDKIMDEYEQFCCTAYDTCYAIESCAFCFEGKQCVNRRHNHQKGHQDKEGEIIGGGDFEEFHGSPTRNKFQIDIREAYRSLAEKLHPLRDSYSSYSKAVLEAHMKKVASQKTFWQQTYSNTTCLLCLFQQPDFFLPCGHSICTTCVRRWAKQPVPNDPYVYRLTECPLCQELFTDNDSAFLELELKPKNTGMRILALDGGGIRGVVSAKILDLLEREINMGVPMLEFFDFIVGTSSGGILALGLTMNQWNPLVCLRQFKELAANSFRYHFLGDLLPLGKIVAWLHQCVYQSEAIEKALFDAFSESSTRYLFGKAELNKQKRLTYRKVALTTHSVTSRDVVILSNYNRLGDTEAARLYREEDSTKEMQVWESARCTSAAPWYFAPYTAPNGETFQDGGLKHNNPAQLATKEAGLLWPQSGIDTVISIGTGYSDDSKEVTMKDPAVPKVLSRLWESFMDSLDSEKIWREFQSNLEPEARSRHHRLNVRLKTVPDIDQIKCMDSLTDATAGYFDYEVPRDRLSRAACALIAGIFYCHILSVNPQGDKYLVQGMITCRLDLKHHPSAMWKLISRGCLFHVNNTILRPSKDDFEAVCEKNSRMMLNIKYYIDDLHEKFNIALSFNERIADPKDDGKKNSIHDLYQISGSPWTHADWEEKIACI